MSVVKKVYPDSFFLQSSRSKFLWYGSEEGEEVVKSSLEKKLEKIEKVLKERKHNGLENLAILLLIEVPVKYEELLKEGNYIEKRINQYFPEFKTKAGDNTKEIRDRIEKELGGEDLSQGVINIVGSWFEQEYIRSIEFEELIPRRCNVFLGIKKN